MIAAAVSIGIGAGLGEAVHPPASAGAVEARRDTTGEEMGADLERLLGRADSAAAVEAPAPRPASPALVAARAVLASAGIESGARAAEVQTALSRLSARVGRKSDPDALRMAFRAYFNYRAAHPEEVRKPYLYFVDYGLDSRTPRGWVFDMDALKVVDGPFTVAHGRGSAPEGEGVPTLFSNRSGSATSSLGLFLAQEVYEFTGHAGGQVYRSIGMRMRGLSGRFNSAARERRVVAHGAPYVTPDKAGRSEGCPAMEPERARELLPKLGGGGLVFLFSPRDRTWLREDPWASGGEVPPVPAMGD
ncbi:MAG TPA: murein L,D-transpeptidase catalytic domain family protein [Longimicrobium sp.]